MTNKVCRATSPLTSSTYCTSISTPSLVDTPSKLLSPSYLRLSAALNGYSCFSSYKRSPTWLQRKPSRFILPSDPQTLDSAHSPRLRWKSYTNGIDYYSVPIVEKITNPVVSEMAQASTVKVMNGTSSCFRPEAYCLNEVVYRRCENSSGSNSSEGSSLSLEESCEGDVVDSSSTPTSQNISLIQRQIQRLYGPSSSYRRTAPFASKATAPVNGTEVKNRLESLQPLKVPAVFKLLRPEFREQLGGSSHGQHQQKTLPKVLVCHSNENVSDLAASTPSSNGTTNGDSHVENVGCNGHDPQDVHDVQDGHYFLKLMANRVVLFKEKICEFEASQDSDEINEEAKSMIFAAIGKANLLMDQKFVQFSSLCHKNINVLKCQDPYVPTDEDLAGFWDMVSIQVTQILELFDDLSKLKKNSWKIVRTQTKPISNRQTKKKLINKASSSPNSVALSEARNASRSKMLLERKKLLLKEKSALQQTDLDVQIFI